ncbi:hypothetical protein ABIC35_001526 [Sphingomonas trueperi]
MRAPTVAFWCERPQTEGQGTRQQRAQSRTLNEPVELPESGRKRLAPDEAGGGGLDDATRRGSRSSRVAWQYVVDLAGRTGVAL